jgi:superfamily II DNA or RNA helicase
LSNNWKHQDIALERYKGSEYFGLLFDCGTGKTRTTIKIAEAKELPVLIIAPNNLCKQWKEAIEEHGRGGDTVFVFQNDKKNTKKHQKAFDAFLEE